MAVTQKIALVLYNKSLFIIQIVSITFIQMVSVIAFDKKPSKEDCIHKPKQILLSVGWQSSLTCLASLFILILHALMKVSSVLALMPNRKWLLTEVNIPAKFQKPVKFCANYGSHWWTVTEEFAQVKNERFYSYKVNSYKLVVVKLEIKCIRP